MVRTASVTAPLASGFAAGSIGVPSVLVTVLLIVLAPPASTAEAQPNGPAIDEALPDLVEAGVPVYAEPTFDGPFWQQPGYGWQCPAPVEPCRPCRRYRPPPGRWWFNGQYLLWWTEGSRIPPLVTTSPQGTPQADAGVLGRPGTRILFGNTSINTDSRSGGRFRLGYWLNCGNNVGVEASYLGLGTETTRYRASSSGNPILARPFFDITAPAEDSHLIAYPDLVEGSVAVDATTDFQMAGVSLRRSFLQQYCSGIDGFGGRGYRIDFLVGYRFGRLDDDLRISESLVTAGPTTIDLYDLFDASNQFHGAELGVVAKIRRYRWSLELLMKLALGNSRSRVFIDGSTTTTADAGPPATADGGLLALTTNMGRYTQNEFAVIPELGVTLGYDITPRLRATFGYTFVYWSRVARAGDQISRDLNPSYFPNDGPPSGPARPEFSFATTDFWAQGMNFGFEYRF